MTTGAPAAVELLKTALYERHVAANARIVEFSGWQMPIQYRGIRAEHLAVRSSVGVFDLSHMGRLYVRGKDAHALVQWLATNDVTRLAPGRAQYSLLCGSDGRILDDIVVYNLGAEVLVVVNASNRDKILRWIQEQQSGPASSYDATVHDATLHTTMIGYQGPDSERSLQPLVESELEGLRYYAGARSKVAGREGLVARTGYTGEDGFELIVPAADGPALWDRLLEERAGVIPTACGLGARDTLRLEAGMALYGHEIDEQTNPYEAGLGRVVKLEKGPFVSRDALQPVADTGVRRRLIGFELEGGGDPRQGYPILGTDGDASALSEREGVVVGHVTSGNVSPSLGTPIGMGYVPTDMAEPGQGIAIEIRGRATPARVVEMPFYQHRTKRARRAA